jgi:hypothetical protein
MLYKVGAVDAVKSGAGIFKEVQRIVGGDIQPHTHGVFGDAGIAFNTLAVDTPLPQTIKEDAYSAGYVQNHRTPYEMLRVATLHIHQHWVISLAEFIERIVELVHRPRLDNVARNKRAQLAYTR